MSLTSGRFTHSRLGHLAVASLFLMAAAPLPGCGDSQPAVRTPAMAGRDGGPAPAAPVAAPPARPAPAESSGTAGSGGSAARRSPARTLAWAATWVSRRSMWRRRPPRATPACPSPTRPRPRLRPRPAWLNMPCDVRRAGGKGLCRNSVCAACNGTGRRRRLRPLVRPQHHLRRGPLRGPELRQLPQLPDRASSASPPPASARSARRTPSARGTPVYGANFICINGKCIDGDCRDSTQCAAGKICGVPMANNCGNCANSAQCAMDPRYRDTSA